MKLFRLLAAGLVAIGLASASAQTVTATKDDATPALTRKLPGAPIDYTVVISNTGGANATGVVLTDPTPANTTLVAGSVHASPLAIDDTFATVGNTKLYIGTTPPAGEPAVSAAGGILTNDSIATPPDTIVFAGLTGPTTQGGSVVVNANGTFTYTPPVGFTGTDTFTYTLSNSAVPALTGSGTVSIAVTNRVWYVNNAGANGTGVSTAPFNTLAGAQTASAANDFIYVFTGSGNYTGGITLKSGQRLIGNGSTLIVGGNTLRAPGTRPTLAHNTAATVVLNSGNTVSGLNVTNSSGGGISGTNVGTLTLADFDVTVSGGLAALSAITSGTITVTGADNDLSANGGVALNVANVNIGAGGLTFKSIAATGGVSGIILNNTGTSGGLTVTGSGSATQGGDNSGGTIQSTTGDAISLTSTHSVSLANMRVINVTGAGAQGISGSQITGTHLFKASRMDNVGGLSSGDGNGITLVNTSVNMTIFSVENCVFANSAAGTSHVLLNPNGPVTVRLDVKDSLFEGMNPLAVQSNSGGNAVVTTNITNNTFRNASADGQGGTAVTTAAGSAGSNTFVVSGNTYFGLHNGVASGANAGTAAFQTTGGLLQGSILNNTLGTAADDNGDRRGIEVVSEPDVSANGNTGRVDVIIEGNILNRYTNRETIFVDLREDTQNSELIIRNNNIGNLAGFVGQVGGLREAIDVQVRGEVTYKLDMLVTANNVTVTSDVIGVNIEVNADAGSPGAQTLNAHITNNTITQLGIGTNLTARTRTSDPNVVLNLNLSGNNFENAAGSLAIEENSGDVNVQQTSSANVTAVNNGVPVTIVGALDFGIATPAAPAGLRFAASAPELSPEDAPAALLPAQPVLPGDANASELLTQQHLDSLVSEAVTRWEASGLSAEQGASLRSLQFGVSDLPGMHLGHASGRNVQISSRAAGQAWYIDPTPQDDAEFSRLASTTRRAVAVGDRAAGRVDLLTAILHEMGHTLGLADSYDFADRNSVMFGYLTTGERRLPAKGQALGAVPFPDAQPHFLSAPLTIGTLPPGKTVTVVFRVTINATTAPSIVSQGTVSGGNFANVLTNDPNTGAAADATVTLVEQPPVVTNVGPLSVNEDAILTFTGANFAAGYSDPNGDAIASVRITSLPAGGTLRLNGSTFGVPQDIPIANIGTLTYTPTANTNGSDSFGWNASDGTLLAVSGALVNITINPVNDEPTLDAIPNPAAVLEDAGQQTINLSGIGAGGGETQTLTVTATSNNTGLIPNPAVTYTSANNTGSLSYTPVGNQSGSAIITVTVMDNGGTANGGDNSFSRTFTVNVTSVNDEPTLDAITNPAQIPVSSPQQTINLSGIGAGGSEVQTLTVTATSGNTGLVPNPTVTYTSPNATGSLAYTPVAGQSGSALITVTVMDNGGTANGGVNSRQRTFTVNVGAPNVSPTIDAQNPVSTVQETAREIVFGDLLVTDPDNSYPTGFTLTVMDGANYTRVGNTITPGIGYTGPLTVPVKVNDGNSDSNTFSLSVTVTPASTAPVSTALFAKGDAVPGAGSPNGPPADAIFSSFGVPAINDNVATIIAFVGKWKSPDGSGGAIFSGGPATATVKLGDTAPDASGSPQSGVTFKTFKDPVLAADGSVAFIAKITGTGVTSANDTAVFSNTGGTLRLVAQEGATLPGTPVGSELKTFTSASLSSTGGDAWIVFTGSLRLGAGGAPGPGGVTKTEDTGAWRWKASTGAISKIIREGEVVAGVGPSTVKSFRLLKSSGGSPGQSRGQYAGANATFLVYFADKSKSLVDSDESGVTEIFGTGDATVPGVPLATWKSFGSPAVPAVAGNGLAFLGQLNANLGGVVSADAKRLFFAPTSGADVSVKLTDPAPGIGGAGALFYSFKDPLLSPSGNTFAFIAGTKGAGVTKSSDSGIWWQTAAGSLTLAAQEGAQPPDSDAGAEWKTFSSVATSDKGPLFTARLRIGTSGAPGPGGIVAATDTGLWATTSTGELRKLIQEGDTLDTKTVKNFTVLKAASGSQGVRRSFAAHGTAVVRVNFTDGGVALYEITVP